MVRLAVLATVSGCSLLPAQILPKLPKFPLGRKPAAEPTAPAPDAPAPGGVGIAFRPGPDGTLVVAQLAPGGAAERARVPLGATLRAVDGKRVAGLSPEQVRTLCTGAIGSLVTLTLEAEREVLDVVLERRALAAAPAADGPAPQPGNGAIAGLPDWLRPGARLTYYTGQATVPGVSTQMVPDPDGRGWTDGNGRRWREEEMQGTGGGGYTQYDLVHVAADSVVAMQSTHVFADAGLRTTTFAGAQAMVGDGNGLTDVWVPPARLQALLADGGGATVRRVRYPLDGQTFDAVVQQIRSQDGWARHTWDLATGVLLVYSASSVGKPVLTRTGNTMAPGAGATTITSVVLRQRRQVNLPWTGQGTPDWLQPGRRLDYVGQASNSLGAGITAPWPYAVAVTIDRRQGAAVLAQLATQIDYGTGQPQQQAAAVAYGPGSFANLCLDPRTVQGLPSGRVLDQDPITGRQLIFLGSDGRIAAIREQGPLDQHEFRYDMNSGVLLGSLHECKQGPALLRYEVQLQSPAGGR